MAHRMPMIVLLLVLVLSAAVVLAGTNNVQVVSSNRAQSLRPSHDHRSTLDDTLFYEDWEDGITGWVGRDLRATPATWHLDDYMAFGGTGTSWWVGDSTVGPNGGYLNEWYMALNSPPMTLPATNPTLLFWHRYSCEPPVDVDPPYDGWDGMNIRISIDSGATWTVIPNTAVNPAYDRQHLYSFGMQHHEGPNIPGWCGANTTWHLQTANLSQWAGLRVMIRWAFASDPAYCTWPDDPSMFGWMVDHVRVYSGTDTVFSDECNAVDGWTTLNVLPTGGNLWRIGRDASSLAGPTVIMCNNVSTGLYNPNMNDVLESPYIDLRGLPFGQIWADVFLRGTVVCPDGAFPDCDYFGAEISPDSGQTWCAMSNPTCDANDTNYVYTGMPDAWALFSESYTAGWEDLYQLAGHVVKFRFTFQSNADAQVDEGPMFDGFRMEFIPGYANDIECYTLQARYPNVANRAFKIKAYFRNAGSDAQNDVQSFWRLIAAGRNPVPFLPTLNLAMGQTASRQATVTVASSGTYEIRAWSALTTDENMGNDTSYAESIFVQPTSQSPEIGYDNRTIQYRFNYPMHGGPLVHFTPLADSLVVGSYNLQTIVAAFASEQFADDTIRYHVYRGGTVQPGQEIYSRDVVVLLSETGAWKVEDIHADPDTRNMMQDFWVWLEVITADTNVEGQRFPQVLGNSAEPWDDVHFYTWQSGLTPQQSEFFYMIHATIDQGNAADDAATELPDRWALGLNYPNPFNPITEIRYSVPRSEPMTLKVYNVMGQEVATLANGIQNPGMHIATFDGSKLASGVYVYRLEAPGFTASQKMLLMK